MNPPRISQLLQKIWFWIEFKTKFNLLIRSSSFSPHNPGDKDNMMKIRTSQLISASVFCFVYCFRNDNFLFG